jgi:sugar lactone lactonase YvrE
MTVDSIGRLYVTTRAGLQMFDPTGRLGGAIAKPHAGPLSNVCFGGPKLDTLYVTAGDKVYRRKVQATGVRYQAR